MKFYNSRTDTDCLAAGVEFLLQKPREKINKLLKWKFLSFYGAGDSLYCLWDSPVFKNKIGISKKSPSITNKLLVIQWSHAPRTSHILLQRGKKVYDPFLKKTFKSFEDYKKKHKNPKIICYAFKK